MTFQAALKKTADEIEALLDTLLSLETARAPRVTEAMRYSALAQGKRLRPFLVVESAVLFDVPREWALRVGAALEALRERMSPRGNVVSAAGRQRTSAQTEPRPGGRRLVQTLVAFVEEFHAFVPTSDHSALPAALVNVLVAAMYFSQ